MWISHQSRLPFTSVKSYSSNIFYSNPNSHFILKLLLNIEMKPLELHQKIMTWIFIVPNAKSNSKFQTVLFATFGCIAIVSQVFAVATSFAYFIKFLSIDIEQSLYTTFQITACASAAYVFILACFSRHQIQSLFEHLTAICDTCKYSIPNEIYSSSPKCLFPFHR